MTWDWTQLSQTVGEHSTHVGIYDPSMKSRVTDTIM